MSSNQKAFIFTGFSRFGGLNCNVTQMILNNFDQNFMKKHSIIYTEILDVSVQKVNNFLNKLNQILKKYNTYYIYIIHMGISPQQGYKIQQCAFNCMKFDIPDENNYQPNNEIINTKFKLNEKSQTKINVKKLNSCLQKKFNSKISQNPGRFLCNYIYFKSLIEFQQNFKNVKGILFVHFNYNNKNIQKHKNFIEELCSYLKQQ